MQPKKFLVLQDRVLRDEVMVKAGEYVYDQWGCDYGLASDDSRYTGIEHITVTLNSDGSYPGFTIPLRDLREVPRGEG